MDLTAQPNNSRSFNNTLFSLPTSQQLSVVKNFVEFCHGVFDLTNGNDFRAHLLDEGLAFK